MKDINNFSFWCPIDFTKAIDETTGEEIMLLGGIASTADEDSDGEFLDPKGFDIKPLLKSGLVNWHHQAKTNPGTIVGEPTKAEIRKEGLYIETKLYPSSEVAQEIWELAKTLDRDSKTRRLGYSIEGKVLERGSDDKTSPDYKKVTKAVITGVAITHMPKNPKTFANIIKGEIDEDLEDEDETPSETKEEARKRKEAEDKYYEGVNMKPKSLTAEGNGKPLVKESVEKKLKNVTFGKAEVMEKLFQDIPGISITKAKEIYNLIKTVSNMAKKKMVTEDDITKAYDALGLTPQTLFKGDDENDLPDEDAEDDDANEDEDDDENKKVKKGNNAPDPDDEEEDDDVEPEDDDDNDEDEDDDEDDAKKAQIFGRFDRIEKALAISHLNQTKFIKALGVMVKAQSQDLQKAIGSLEEANEKIDEQSSIIKSQQDEISNLTERLESFGSGVNAPKSLRHAAPVERSFNKGEETDLEKGSKGGMQTVSIKNRQAISEILDQATFSKGFDNEFSNACTGFEATGQIAPNIIARLKNELGVNITA